jgi:hypothetical protein
LFSIFERKVSNRLDLIEKAAMVSRCRYKPTGVKRSKVGPMPKNATGHRSLAEIARLQWTFPGRPPRLPSWMNDVPVLVEIPLGAGA